MAGWIEVLASGLVGNLIGAGISYFATKAATNAAFRRADVERQREVRGLLRALYVEVNLLWSDYRHNKLERVMKVPDEDVLAILLDRHDAPMCPVFQQSVSQIGRIQDEGQIRAIVQFHSYANALDASFSENNKLLYEVKTRMAETGSLNFRKTLQEMPVQFRLMQATAKNIKSASDKLKAAHDEVEARVTPYLDRVDG